MFFYLYSIQETIKLVQEKNRKLAIWQVWLGLVPVFNLILQYLIVANLMSSLYAEFRDRKTKYPLNNMKTLGGAYCLLILLGLIPVVGILCLIASFVCWIIFWTKVVDVKKVLQTLPLEIEFGQKDF
jgi:hypothetical protein